MRAISIAAAVGLAPIADLERAHVLRLGGSPTGLPERYGAASPRRLLPLGVPQLLLHGAEDGAVPIDLSRGCAGAERAAGDSIELVELPGVGHREDLDPASDAHATLGERLERSPVGAIRTAVLSSDRRESR